MPFYRYWSLLVSNELRKRKYRKRTKLVNYDRTNLRYDLQMLPGPGECKIDVSESALPVRSSKQINVVAAVHT